MTDPRRTRLEEQRAQALTDLREVEVQVAAGEVDATVADKLRRHSQAAAADAMEALDRLEGVSPPKRTRRRVLLGAGVFIVVAVVVTITLISAVEPRPEGGFAAEGVATDIPAETPIDLSTITTEEMEQVVAASPEILPMRLALARRYVEAGEFGLALPHYLFVLDRETNPEALMYLGWMTYLSGEAATGVALLQQSLAILPGEPATEWFLANALYHGMGDTEGAAPHLRAVIESGQVPNEIIVEAQRLLDEASQ